MLERSDMGLLCLAGYCVKKFEIRVRWSNLFGVLARPFDLTSIAVNGVQA